jgi:hypothetical protein
MTNIEAIMTAVIDYLESAEDEEWYTWIMEHGNRLPSGTLKNLALSVLPSTVNDALDHMYGETTLMEDWAGNGPGEGPTFLGSVIAEMSPGDLADHNSGVAKLLEAPDVATLCEEHGREWVEEQIAAWRRRREVY